MLLRRRVTGSGRGGGAEAGDDQLDGPAEASKACQDGDQGQGEVEGRTNRVRYDVTAFEARAVREDIWRGN